MSEPTQPAYRIALDQFVAIRLTGYAIALLYVAVGIVFAVGPGGFDFDGPFDLLINGIGALVVCVATLAVHELVHGLFMRLFGGSPRYGVGRLNWIAFYAYATAPGVPFTLRQMTAICLAPLVVISAGTLAIAWVAPAAGMFAMMAFATNFSGAAGDLWMVVQIWRFRRCHQLSFADVENGLDIHTPDPAASAIAAALAARRNSIGPRILLRWLAASSLMLAAVVPLGLLISMSTLRHVTIGPRQFAMVSYDVSATGAFDVALDIGAVLVAGLICALLSLIVVRPAKRRVADEPPSAGSPHPALL